MKKEGQSLFELVIAIGIVALVLVAILSASTISVRNSTFSKEQAIASRFTQQAIEWLRGQRDGDWNTFKSRGSSTGTTWCLNSLDWNSVGVCNSAIPSTNFSREAEIIYNPAADKDQITVTVSTFWTDGSKQHSIEVTTVLSNWKAK